MLDYGMVLFGAGAALAVVMAWKLGRLRRLAETKGVDQPWRAINLACGGGFTSREAEDALTELRRRGWGIKKVGNERSGLVWLRLSAPGLPMDGRALGAALAAARAAMTGEDREQAQAELNYLKENA